MSDQFGIYVPGGVGHYHVEQGKPVTYSSRSAAQADLPRVQSNYFHECRVQPIDQDYKIRRSGVIEGKY